MTVRRINDSTTRMLVAGSLAVLIAGCATAASAPTPSATSVTPTTTPLPAPTQGPTLTPTLDLEASLDGLFGTAFNGSVLVSKDGKVLFAKGIGMADDATKVTNAPETRFRIGSITKQFTAMAILILESRGVVNRSDAVCDYIDTCPNGWQAVTIEHLLGHTAGIAGFTEQPDFDGMKAATPAETVASVADVPLSWTPGEFFGYSNTGYVLLGMVVEKASAQAYEAFLQDEIFGPLGMKDSGYEHGDTPGLATGYIDDFDVAAPLDMSVPYAAGGLYSTVLDLERWASALATNQLAPAAEMATYVTPLKDITDRTGLGYAYGQYVGDDRGSRLVAHDGGINGFYTQLSRYPDDGILVVLLTNRESSPDLWELARSAARLARDASS